MAFFAGLWSLEWRLRPFSLQACNLPASVRVLLLISVAVVSFRRIDGLYFGIHELQLFLCWLFWLCHLTSCVELGGISHLKVLLGYTVRVLSTRKSLRKRSLCSIVSLLHKNSWFCSKFFKIENTLSQVMKLPRRYQFIWVWFMRWTCALSSIPKHAHGYCARLAYVREVCSNSFCKQIKPDYALMLDRLTPLTRLTFVC